MSVKQKPFQILFLYPNEMNIYGDTGNAIVLQKRLQWRGYDADIIFHHPGQAFTHEPDIIVGGGGQDSGQRKVFEDLLANGERLRDLADAGVPMLVVCGLYQLFGHGFYTHDGDSMKGIGIFNAETHATSQRLIGNVTVDSDFGTLIGYENHSGQTRLLGDQKPFGTVTHGYGNNAEERHEGAIYRNVYGTYLHGSILPKNPVFADALIAQALKNRGERSVLKPLDDKFASQAREKMFTRI